MIVPFSSFYMSLSLYLEFVAFVVSAAFSKDYYYLLFPMRVAIVPDGMRYTCLGHFIKITVFDVHVHVYNYIKCNVLIILVKILLHMSSISLYFGEL